MWAWVPNSIILEHRGLFDQVLSQKMVLSWLCDIGALRNPWRLVASCAPQQITSYCFQIVCRVFSYHDPKDSICLQVAMICPGFKFAALRTFEGLRRSSQAASSLCFSIDNSLVCLRPFGKFLAHCKHLMRFVVNHLWVSTFCIDAAVYDTFDWHWNHLFQLLIEMLWSTVELRLHARG